MVELKQLNLKHSSLKTQLTKFQTFIESEAARVIVKIEVRLSKLQETWSTFEEV